MGDPRKPCQPFYDTLNSHTNTESDRDNVPDACLNRHVNTESNHNVDADSDIEPYNYVYIHTDADRNDDQGGNINHDRL